MMRRLIPVVCAVALAFAGCGASPAGVEGMKCRPRRRCPTTTTTTTTTTVPTTTTTTAPTTTTTGAPQPGVILSGEQAGFAVSRTPFSDSLADLTHQFDNIAATGAKWVRLSLEWSSLETTPGTVNWTPIDNAVALANARGLHVLANPAYTPSWARSGSDDKYPPSDPNTYASFVTRAVQRYAPQGVHVWEVWNEPNIVNFWHPQPDPAGYATLLRSAYSAIHAADPSAVVLTGGTAPTGATLDSMGSDGKGYSPYRWLRLLYEGGNRPYFDAVATHPYASFPNSPNVEWGNTMQMDDIHGLMAANGDDAKKLWGTEAGYPTGTASGAVSEATQATFIEDYLEVWRDFGAFTGPLFVYQMRDRGTNASSREDNFGLVHNDWTEKPAYSRFSADVG